MTRYLQRLISAGIFAGLLALAVSIISKQKRSGRDKAVFSAIAGGFALVGILAICGVIFVAVQIAKFGDAGIGLWVAVLLLLAAGIAFIATSTALIITYRQKKA